MIPQTSLWAAVDRLVDGTNDLHGLRAHRLQLLAARRWRATERPLPAAMLAEEQSAALAALVAPVLLARVRSAVAGPILLLKGPEVAVRYPEPTLRPFGDLDLLVPEPAEAFRALLAAGFQQPATDRTDTHHYHLPPLRWPGLPLAIEVHAAPPWLGWMRPPPTEALFAGAVPASSGVAGVVTLPRSHHVMLLVAHAWRHAGPLPLVGDIVDVTAMADGVDRDELDTIASAWGVDRAWAVMKRTSEALVGGHSQPSWSDRGWSWFGLRIRERIVVEDHLLRWLGGLWAPSLAEVPRAVAWSIGRDLRRRDDEGWFSKGRRAVRSARVAHKPLSERGDPAPGWRED